MINIDPIGYVHCRYTEKADVPRQGALARGNQAVIRLFPGKNFEQALEDLEGMERVWILFWMHEVTHFKAKVQPPRAVTKKGLFATRSPHRPNPIGLSCVRLTAVKGLELYIEDHDLLEGTPVLDIKPYLPYADSFPDAKTGWMQEKVEANQIRWSDKALKEVLILQEQEGINLQEKIEARLDFFSKPSSSNRIKHIKGDFYLQSYKFWRIVIEKKTEEPVLYVLTVLKACDTNNLNTFF
ncbi:MAG: tRNA (N6-threonylcarbamoyladenosine(37)-N6)-methyltransferase TrmO [Chlamydiota bacterium]